MTRYTDHIRGDLPASERCEGHSKLVVEEGKMHVVDPHPQQEFVLLLELFEADGNSARLYWSGKLNRIDVTPRGITVTYNVHAARKIPLVHRDIAEALADALNKVRVGEGLTRQWRVVQHGFIS